MGAGFEVGNEGITQQAPTLIGSGSGRRWSARIGADAERIEARSKGPPLPHQIIELPLPLPGGAEDAQGHAASQAETLGLHQIPGWDAIGGKQRFRGENEDEGVTHARLLDGQLICRVSTIAASALVESHQPKRGTEPL